MLDGQLWAFLIAITLLTIAPGVDTVMVTRNAMRGGIKDGVVTSAGICSGLFIHAAVSASGLSLILLGSAQLFQMVKLAGAAYLVWMGLQSLLAALKGGGVTKASKSAAGRLDVKRSLREGFLSNVLNPKTAVFYMAFLPQFIDPSGHAFWQAQALASIHIVIAMTWQCFLVMLVARSRQAFSAPKMTRWINALVGTVLIGFALKLAFERD